jgi:hypothetical protein
VIVMMLSWRYLDVIRGVGREVVVETGLDI